MGLLGHEDLEYFACVPVYFNTCEIIRTWGRRTSILLFGIERKCNKNGFLVEFHFR